MRARRPALVTLLTCVFATVPATSALAAYGFIQEWGGAGTGHGQFTDLRDVATDTNGNVFALEADRIQKFGPDRAYLRSVTPDPGYHFESLTVRGAGADGVVYVVDRDHGVLRYRSSDLAPLTPVNLAPVAQTTNFAKPRRITTDYLGNLIITFPNDYGAAAPTVSGVAMYQSTGVFIRTLGLYGATDPGGAAAPPENFNTAYLTPVDVDDDQEVNGVGGNASTAGSAWIADADAAKLRLQSLPRDNDPDGYTARQSSPLWHPAAVAVMPADPVFGGVVAKTSIYSWGDWDGTDTGGTFEAMNVWRDTGGAAGFGKFGQHGTGAGKFSAIAAIDIDGAQRMFVADPVQAKILEYGNGGSPGPGDPTEAPPSSTPPPAPTPDPSSGSGVPPPSSGNSGANPISQLPESDQLIVCFAFYATQGCGAIPQPTPLKVCVSLWENCNGFNGMKAAPSGTIDMSGFPSSLTVDAGCAGRSSPTRRAVVRQAASPSQVECILDGYFEAPAGSEELARKKLQLQYQSDARVFKAEVGRSYDVVISGLQIATENLTGNDDAERARLAIRASGGAALDAIFTSVATPGRPYKAPTGAVISVPAICDPIATVEAKLKCQAVITALDQTLVGSLGLLAQRKTQLYLDLSIDDYVKLLNQKDADNRAAKSAEAMRRRDELVLVLNEYNQRLQNAQSEDDRQAILKDIARIHDEIAALEKKAGLAPRAVASAKAKKKRRAAQKTIYLGYGRATIAPGKRGKLKIRFTKANRAYLRALRRTGVKKIRAVFVLRGGSTPGVDNRQFRLMTLRLAGKPKRGKHGRG